MEEQTELEERDVREVREVPGINLTATTPQSPVDDCQLHIPVW